MSTKPVICKISAQQHDVRAAGNLRKRIMQSTARMLSVMEIRSHRDP